MMADVIVIGDGPGGLSSALFLAKNGKDVLVFGHPGHHLRRRWGGRGP